MQYQAKHEAVLSRCRGRRVLHLGCVGNNDYSTVHKVAASPNSLHMKLSAIANVTGVDISADAVEEYRKTGICDNILVGDVEKLGQLPLTPEFDLIVVGDLIEHLSNPGLMLDGVRALCGKDTKVILTTPHAFGLAPFLKHLAGRFREGLQHVMTFNEQNLRNLVERHGFRVEESGTCYQPESADGTAVFILGKCLFKVCPKLGGTLIFILAPSVIARPGPQVAKNGRIYPSMYSSDPATSEKSVKILHWAPQYGSETGTGKAIKEWLQASSASGLDVTVVSEPRAAEPSVVNPGFRVLSARGLARKLAVFWREARSTNVVHLHGAFDFRLSVVYLLLLFEMGRRIFTGPPLRIVMTPHGALSQQVFSRSVLKKRLYWSCVDRLLTERIHTAICTTPVEARELGRLMPHVKMEVVPLVVSPQSKPAAKPRQSTRETSPRGPLLCTLGRYDIEMKGLDLLIGAVLKLNREGCPVRLRCIGYDRNHGTRGLEDYVRSVNAGEFVECTGPKYGREKDLAVAECDVFCMPSRYESFSYALIEGLESGLPVLVGAGACLTSYFDDDQQRTMVVAPEADAWAASIKRLLADPATNLECAESILQELYRTCSSAVVGESLGVIYRSIAASAGTAALESASKNHMS